MHFDRIGESGLDQVLARRLTTPGGAVAPTVAPELFAGVTLEEDRPEWGYLKSELWFAGRTSNLAAGGAGLRSAVQLFNPHDSQLIVVVKSLDAIAAAGNVELIVRIVGAGITPTGTVQTGLGPRDTRAQSGGSFWLPRLNVITDNTNAVLGTSGQARVVGRLLATSRNWSEQPFVLGPGTLLWIAPDADNVALSATSFVWTERKAQPGEL